MTLEQDVVHISVLVILAVAALSDKRASGRKDLLLCADILLAGSFVIDLLNRLFSSNVDEGYSYLFMALQIALTLISFILLLIDSFIEGRSKSSIEFFLPLIRTLFFPCLCICFFSVTDDFSLFPSAVMLSLLMCMLSGRKLQIGRLSSNRRETAKEAEMKQEVFVPERDNITDVLLLDNPVPFKWEMSNIDHYLALIRRSFPKTDVVYDLRALDFPVPPLSVCRLFQLMAETGRDADKGLTVIITTEFTNGKAYVAVESASPEDFTEIGPQLSEKIRKLLEEENNRLQIQCQGSVRSSVGEKGMHFVMMVPSNKSA